VVPNGLGIRVPESINNRALLLANTFLALVPAKDSQTAEIVVLSVVCNLVCEGDEWRKSRVELGEGDLVPLDSLPVAGWCGVNWS
jgi:hypothetical protein